MAEGGTGYDDEIAQHLQPHLKTNETALEYVNPALELDEPSDVQSNSQQQFKLPPPPREPQNKKQSEDTNYGHNQITTDTANGGSTGSYPVYYNANGNVVVGQSQPVKATSSGNSVIQTAVPFPENGPHTWRDIERQRPLTAKRLRLLKIFGIIAAIVFFPLGIPAALFAFKAEKELHEGILKGNIDYAQKCAKRSERLIIFSWMFAILVAVITFALVERTLLSHEEKNTVRNRVLPH